MLLKVSLLFLLLCAPIIEAQAAVALLNLLSTAASPGEIISAADPFNCEVEQAKNAANLFNKLAQNLITIGKPASEGAIIDKLELQAGRVAKTTTQLGVLG
ncbi:hypothetical protein PRIPAC_78215 [Pristionchus pacificus]|uniref:Uncharacterized protein n=1 Tax=Pristionchus pacificus TaxID=54126 RepID=A0A2A6CKJ9_PRIPA|nr:hypothetical protein PRIPAC_78215 [Pristionchus pacificus]|eukprot:PDM78744.1 hypothetical protein PRIPAC_31323 [Pristionchus pacificus]